MSGSKHGKSWWHTPGGLSHTRSCCPVCAEFLLSLAAHGDVTQTELVMDQPVNKVRWAASGLSIAAFMGNRAKKGAWHHIRQLVASGHVVVIPQRVAKNGTPRGTLRYRYSLAYTGRQLVNRMYALGANK